MGSNQGRKVRVIAKIRGFTDLEAESRSSDSTQWVSVHKPKGDDSEAVTISFGDQFARRIETYEVDYCYEQNEGNDIIFSGEVKPLISDVFDGHDATIIACGARASGKTHVMQGSEEKPGLAVLAMSELLSVAEASGKSISISLYEILKDQAKDILDPKRPEILVFDTAQGKSQLKGLSQVPVKSISEFQKLYYSGPSSHKLQQKISTEPPHRSHKGLIIHVFHSGVSDTLPIGKMNFVDLAGYEDARGKSTESLGLLEKTKINKSIYALHNVLYSINANESHVPYRESKLTRVLQASLSGINKILLMTCLNPSFCQDSMYMVSLASRSCQGINRTVIDSTKKSKSSARSVLHSSYGSRISGSVSTTQKKPVVSQGQLSDKKGNGMASANKARKQFDEACKFGSVSAIVKKQTGSQWRFSDKKVNVMASEIKERKPFDEACYSKKPVSASASLKKQIGSQGQLSNKKANGMASVKGRKLFDEASHSTKPEKASQKESSSSDIISTLGHSVQEESSSSDNISPVEHSVLEENSSSDISKAMVPIEEEPFPLSELITDETTVSAKGVLHSENNSDEVTPIVYSSAKALSLVEEGQTMDKENKSSLVNEHGSPPISVRLQELSNQMKSLYSSTSLGIEIPPKNDASYDGLMSTGILEPKTPETSVKFNDKWEFASPWQTFSMRSSGMKDSLVQEYLRFLNTANKEDLKKLKGIGEKRATYILELREESPEPFKNLDDLKEIGLSAKQIKGMMRKEVGGLF